MPDDEVLPPPSQSWCPFMPPVMVPSKIGGQIDVRPIPCLGPRDPIRGGGCAAYALCQELPVNLGRLAQALDALAESKA